MLSYELCKKLKDAGFSQEQATLYYFTGKDGERQLAYSLMHDNERLYVGVIVDKGGISIESGYDRQDALGEGEEVFAVPILSELIKACGRQSTNCPWG